MTHVVVVCFIAGLIVCAVLARGLVALSDYLEQLMDARVSGVINGQPEVVSEFHLAHIERERIHGFDPLDLMPRGHTGLLHDPKCPEEVSRRALQRYG